MDFIFALDTRFNSQRNTTVIYTGESSNNWKASTPHYRAFMLSSVDTLYEDADVILQQDYASAYEAKDIPCYHGYLVQL